MSEEKKKSDFSVAKEIVELEIANQNGNVNKAFFEMLREGRNLYILPFLQSPFVERLDKNYTEKLYNRCSSKDLGDGNALVHLFEMYLFNPTVDLEDMEKNKKRRSIINKMLSLGFDFSKAAEYLHYFATLRFDQYEPFEQKSVYKAIDEMKNPKNYSRPLSDHEKQQLMDEADKQREQYKDLKRINLVNLQRKASNLHQMLSNSVSQGKFIPQLSKPVPAPPSRNKFGSVKKSKKSVKKSKKSSSKKSKKSVKKSKKSVTKDECKKMLKRKIKKNIEEYKNGRYSSRLQAVAVSYSQVNKKNPYCKRFLKKKSKE